MADTGGDMRKLAGDMGKVTRGISGIGLGIDTQTLAMVSGAFQLIGGSAQAIKGLRAQKEAYIAWRSAEAAAQLAKWGPWGIAVQAQAQAGAQAMGYMIGEAVKNIQTDGSGQSMRALQGGTYYAR